MPFTMIKVKVSTPSLRLIPILVSLKLQWNSFSHLQASSVSSCILLFVLLWIVKLARMPNLIPTILLSFAFWSPTWPSLSIRLFPWIKLPFPSISSRLRSSTTSIYFLNLKDCSAATSSKYANFISAIMEITGITFLTPSWV